jgi:hypothetical protein
MTQQKKHESNPATDLLATAIAVKIIQWQKALSAALNLRANRIAVDWQKWLLAIFCILSAIALILCIVFPFGKLAMHSQSNNYHASHIGLPSVAPQAQLPQRTDSLTISK